jgi:hypothetical protein
MAGGVLLLTALQTLLAGTTLPYATRTILFGLVVLGAVGVVLLGQPLAHAAIKNKAASRYLLLKMMLIVIDLLRVPHPLSRSHLCIPTKRSEISLVCDVILRSSN